MGVGGFLVYPIPLFSLPLSLWEESRHNWNIVDCDFKKVSEYDQEIPQSHSADQPTAPLGRATEQ